MAREAVLRRIGSLVLFLGPATTLAISPWSNFDPINLIKLLFVTSLAFAILGLLFWVRDDFFKSVDKTLLYASSFFVLWMLVVFFVTNTNKSQQFWGVFGRNTGMLTYLSLVAILVGTSLIHNKLIYNKFVEVIVLTSIPVTVYALIQIAGRDPISWSTMAPFATLGNVNFSSAFFGLASICSTVLVFSQRIPLYVRLFLVFLVVIDLLVILQTGSIQGFMIYIAGVGVATFFWLRSSSKLKKLRIPYLLSSVIAFFLTVVALFNEGPLARFVFSYTVTFRFDYWFAGWAMTIKNPIFGVGLDGYGDWYRQERGEIATLRTTPDRITNTAHNIYLDLSSGGGVPLLIAYLVMIFVAGRAAFRVFRREHEFNPYFVAMFSAWIAYLIQAAISINQIGVGIWGWIFMGAIIGYDSVTRTDGSKTPQRQNNVKGRTTQMPAGAAVAGIFSFALGFALALIPLRADSLFKDSLQVGSLDGLEKSAKSLGATAYHFELALDAALKREDEARASSLTTDLLERYPRDFMAWRVRQILPSTPDAVRLKAFETLRSMDPYNPQIQPRG